MKLSQSSVRMIQNTQIGAGSTGGCNGGECEERTVCGVSKYLANGLSADDCCFLSVWCTNGANVIIGILYEGISGENCFTHNYLLVLQPFHSLLLTVSEVLHQNLHHAGA